jgi:hypothetical protein
LILGEGFDERNIGEDLNILIKIGLPAELNEF